MSAEVLRRAASLMRGCAEAAVAGPWMVDPDEEALVLKPDTPGFAWDGYNVAVTHSNEEGRYVNTPHIASWHPAVALAVADWLDSVADACTSPDEKQGAGRTIAHADEDHALAVARAYLGEQQ